MKLRPFFWITMAVLAVFARTAGFSFIGLDDAGYTFRNPFVATGLSWANIAECFTNFRHGGIWMPLTYMSYMADMDIARITGIPHSAWMHSVNAALHVLDAFLLLLLAERLRAATGNGGPRFFLTLALAFWAVHPMRAEPVAWIACRKELLWVAFTLAGLVFWLRGLSDALSPRKRSICFVLTAAFCAAACLSKPSAMCFPVLAAALHLFVRRSGGTSCTGRTGRGAVVLCYSVLAVTAGCTAAVAAYSQTHVAGQDAVALFAAPVLHRVVHALSALGFYLRATLWPAGLHVDFRITDGLVPLGGVSNLVFLSLAAAALAAVSVRVFRRKDPRAAAALLLPLAWFLVPLVPTLGLFGSFGIEAHADRFTYLPSMAVVLLAAVAPVPAFLERAASKPAFRKYAVAAVAAYGVFAFRQTGFWRDDYTAHLRALDCDPGHPRAMVHVGDALCARTRNFDKGIEFYRRSLAISPREYVKYRLAYALASRGNWDDYLEVMKLGAEVAKDPSLDRRGMMLDALGTAYMARGDWENAIRMFKASIAAPGRFWPKASTKDKLDRCIERIR